MGIDPGKRIPTILIVDDDSRNLKLLEAVLTTEGYRTISASSGKEGRILAREEHPDILLLDVMMPGESGFDTCKLLKEDPHVSDIPVIFISALHDVQSKVAGLGMGAVDYITKPFERLEVLARVRLHLQLRFAYTAMIEMQAAKLRQLHEAQQEILVRPSDLPEANFHISYAPAMEAGGDFYDVFPIGNGIYGYFVADVSGHDLGASYITSAVKALISQNATPMNTPVETMKIMNGVLTAIMPDSKYLTACYAHLNRIQQGMTVVSAGHPPVVYLKANGQVECLEGKGDVLGAFQTVVFEPVYRKVSRGDRFFLYTDGLVEGFGEEKKSRTEGTKNLVDACVESRGRSVAEAVSQIMDRLFPSKSSLMDDLVLMGIEV